MKDILEAAEASERFVKDMNFEQFKKNDLVSSAVIRKFELIGEATRNIPQEIKKGITISHGHCLGNNKIKTS